MTTPRTNTLTQQQRRRIQTPPAGYTVTSAKGRQVLVRRPDRRPMRVRPSGRVVEIDRVESVQSYLHVPAA
jgi:hypothetical protein